jgi:hypothetical protein
VKVFISYSNRDRKTAELLYRDLRAVEAEPYEFAESAMADAAVWSEIVSWISKSDAFVVLISASALGSPAVREEVGIAHFRYINSGYRHPAKIICAVIERGAKPPLEIERFSQIDLVDYAAGRRTLFRQLGLAEPATEPEAPAPALPVADLEQPARRYAESRPADEAEWLERASKLLETIEHDEPANLPKPHEARRIDSLLATMIRQPAGYSSEHPLTAPTLKQEGDSLVWSPVRNAIGYVVERCHPPVFKTFTEVHRGPETFYRPPDEPMTSGAGTYRVKATAGAFRPDSAWSNIVVFSPLKRVLLPKAFRDSLNTLTELARRRPSPPTLTVVRGTSPQLILWSGVDDATGYVLERSDRAGSDASPAAAWRPLFEGPLTQYYDLARAGDGHSYRVKALGSWGETGWSNEANG